VTGSIDASSTTTGLTIIILYYPGGETPGPHRAVLDRSGAGAREPCGRCASRCAIVAACQPEGYMKAGARCSGNPPSFSRRDRNTQKRSRAAGRFP
jgi:hypothetical protein